jgi:GT2 family glycosyltransferase
MLVAALDSVRRQTFAGWELCLVDDGSRDPRVVRILVSSDEHDPRIRLIRREHSGGIARATNVALGMARGEYVACLDHDDVLADTALAMFAAAIAQHPNADILYSDEELFAGDRSSELALKPGWSPDLLRSTMYMCHLTVSRRSLALEVGGYRSEFDGSQDYDFALRITERSERIIHVPGVLYHWRVHEHSAAASETAKPYAYSAARRALEEHIKRTGIHADVHFGDFPGVYRIVHRVPRNRSAAAILPLTGEPDTVATAVTRAVNSWDASEHRPHEVVLVGSPAVLSACAGQLATEGATANMLTVEASPSAGVGAMVNAGAAAAGSDCLVLLDGPVESLTRDWLARLVGFADQRGVAAVGAKTLTLDGRVEHAGVMLSDGLPLPVLHGAEAGEAGPLGIGLLPCNLSAVRGVVATGRKTFSELEGIDEQLGELGVIDFCLRAREAGMRIVSAPDVIVRHLSHAPPINDLVALYALTMRWRNRLGRDPYFNPGFYSDRADFTERPGI